MSRSRQLAAECVGTALLLATVVGSGIMAERLSGGNTGVALLANSMATGAILMALITVFGPASGAHFNPVVSLAGAIDGALPWRAVPGYIVAQITGAVAGVLAAHLMFDLPLVSASVHARSGLSQGWSEMVATFGLVVVVMGSVRARSPHVGLAVGLYIAAAYWFTASTSFANPAVTIARALSDTFAGIRPMDVAPFIAAQLLGGLLATLFMRWLALPEKQPAPGHVAR